jgi:hypothetical protein
MLSAANTLIATTNDANLLATRTAWINTRAAWESCEGFLFGPVVDFNYYPTMGDWPVNKVDLDSLLASNNPLALSDIDPLPTTLKGFRRPAGLAYRAIVGCGFICNSEQPWLLSARWQGKNNNGGNYMAW